MMVPPRRPRRAPRTRSPCRWIPISSRSNRWKADSRRSATASACGRSARPTSSSTASRRPAAPPLSAWPRRAARPAPVAGSISSSVSEGPSVYRYDEIDQAMLADRAAEFREQCRRRLAGEIDEDQFKPIRLMNGLYLQLHAYMLRIAIPYGTLSSAQLAKLAHAARLYDRGYGHFTTRTNLQLHWIKLADAPDILDDLATVGLHAIQTSGNCIRNLTADPHAGATADEVDDPRIWAEAIRQWSTFHPEFSFLPRKFKIAVTAAKQDRAAIRVYDIGLRLHRDEDGELAFEVLAGGGLGRTPYLGAIIRPSLPVRHLLSYLQAILRVYNRYGR